MVTSNINEIAKISPMIADAIQMMKLRGFIFLSAYQDTKGNSGWDISFKTYLSEKEITRFLFDCAPLGAINCDTPFDAFPAVADENYSYTQRDGSDATSIYID